MIFIGKICSKKDNDDYINVFIFIGYSMFTFQKFQEIKTLTNTVHGTITLNLNHSSNSVIVVKKFNKSSLSVDYKIIEDGKEEIKIMKYIRSVFFSLTHIYNLFFSPLCRTLITFIFLIILRNFFS